MTQEEMFNEIELARATITRGQFFTLALGMLLIPLILLLTSNFINMFVFKIDEKKYSEICHDLDQRQNQSEVAL